MSLRITAKSIIQFGQLNESAHIKRNTIFSDEGKVILFITPKELHEMILIKERGEDPSDLILDLVEMFYLQHE